MNNRSPDTIDIAVGERLRLFRINRGLTLEQLADALGVTYQQLRKYEVGQSRLSAGRIWHLARVLNIREQDLFGENPYPLLEVPLTGDLRKLTQRYRQLPPDKRDLLIGISELLVKPNAR